MTPVTEADVVAAKLIASVAVPCSWTDVVDEVKIECPERARWIMFFSCGCVFPGCDRHDRLAQEHSGGLCFDHGGRLFTWVKSEKL